MNVSTWPRFVTSTANPAALPPVAEISFTTESILSVRRAPGTTFAPRDARSFAVLSPKPFLFLLAQSADLEDHFQLDRHSERQVLHSKNQACRYFVFAEDVAQEFRGGIGNFHEVRPVPRRCDIDSELHDS